MGQYREEIVETSIEPETRVVEQRTVRDDGLGSRVVTTTSTLAPPPPVRPTRLVRRFWRRSAAAAPATEYVTAASYGGLDPTLAQFLRISWFLLGLLEVVLALRFMLSLLGANERNDFAGAVYGLTWAFVGPFRTLFATPASGASSFELYTLVAMFFYFAAWWAIVKLIGVVLNRSVDV